MKRRGILLAFMLTASGVAALAAPPNPYYKDVQMFSEVTRLPQTHPLCKQVGPQSKCFHVVPTSAFSNLLQNDRDLNLQKFDDGPEDPPDQIVIKFTIRAYWVSMKEGAAVTLNTTAAGRQTRVDLTAEAPLQWMFSLHEVRSGPGHPMEFLPRAWALVGQCVDEVVEYYDKNGVYVATYLIISNGETGVNLTGAAGCFGAGQYIQTVPTDTSLLQGEWHFLTMAIHAPGVPGHMWPVYDVRSDGSRRCIVVIPPEEAR